MSSHVRAVDVAHVPLRWLWKEHIPHGMICMIAGPPDLGKSLVAWRIAADVSHQHHVIISTAEDHLGIVARPRLDAADANMTNLEFWKPQHPLIPEGLDEIEARVVETGAKLILADPAAAHLRPRFTHDQAVRQAMTPMREMCERLDLTYLMVHHTIKSISPKAHPLGAVGGPQGGLTGSCRVIYLLGSSPDDPDERVLAQLKCNIAVERDPLRFEVDGRNFGMGVEPGVLLFRGISEHKARAVLTASTSGDSPPVVTSKAEAAAAWLRQYIFLAGKPCDRNDILSDAVQQGFSQVTVKRAAKVLRLISSQPGGGRGKTTTWDLPPELRMTLEQEEPDDEDV